MLYVVGPEQVIGKEPNYDDPDENQVFHLGPELLVWTEGAGKFSRHFYQDKNLQAQEDTRNEGNSYNYGVVQGFHTPVLQLFVELEACCIIVQTRASILKVEERHPKDHDEDPHGSTSRDGVQLPVELHLVLPLKEDEPTDHQRDHVKYEGQVHVDVHHGAHHFAKRHIKHPLLFDIVVEAEGHREEEEAVHNDQVNDGSRGHRESVHLEQHKGHCDGPNSTSSKDNRVDSHQYGTHGAGVNEGGRGVTAVPAPFGHVPEIFLVHILEMKEYGKTQIR